MISTGGSVIMLSKIPQKVENSETSNVNSKLIGINIVLIVMLGVAGVFLFSPLLSTTQTDVQFLNTSNSTVNNTPQTQERTNTQQTKKVQHTVTPKHSSNSSTTNLNSHYSSQSTSDNKASSNTERSYSKKSD